MEEILEFHSPRTIAEAVALLKRKGAAAVAGGTDISINRRGDIETLVDITRLGMDEIRREEGAIYLGAAVTVHDLASSEITKGLADGMVADAAGSFISQQIRNAATLGGNLARSSPAADLPPSLLALDAVAVIKGANEKGRVEERRVPLTEFFTGPGKNVLNGDLLVGISIPELEGCRGSFQKIGRTSEDLAIVNAGVSLRLEEGRYRNVRIALGAVGPTPMRMYEAEKALDEQMVEAKPLEDVARIVQECVKPVNDHRASAAYRRKVSGVLVRRGLEACLRRAGVLE